MRKGDVAPIWLPAGKFVTRWKEDTPSINSAIIAHSEDECKDTLAAKFDQKPTVLRRIGLFEFLGWADEQELEPAVRGIRPEPLVSFAKVLTAAQIKERLTEVIEMVDSADTSDDWYVEIFVRSRSQVDDDDTVRRFGKRNRPRGHRGSDRR